MKEYRIRNKDKLKQFWKVEIDDKAYVFKNKKDIKISRIKQNEIDDKKHTVIF